MENYTLRSVVKEALRDMIKSKKSFSDVFLANTNFYVIDKEENLEINFLDKKITIHNPLSFEESLIDFDNVFHIPHPKYGFDYPLGFWVPTDEYLSNVEPEGMISFDYRFFNFDKKLVFDGDNKVIGRIINEGEILDRSKL